MIQLGEVFRFALKKPAHTLPERERGGKQRERDRQTDGCTDRQTGRERNRQRQGQRQRVYK